MKATRPALVLCGLLAALGQARSAHACGSSATPYYDVDTLLPTGTGVPLNTPIQIGLKQVAEASGDYLFEPVLTLTKAGSKDALEVKSVGRAPALVYVPVEALEPNTTYDLSLNGLPAADAATAPGTNWQLVTGSVSTPALSLTGKLEVTLEPGTDPIMDCSNANDCGGGCVASGTLAVTKARVKLPRVTGGFAKRTGSLALTDDTARVFGKDFDATPHDVNTGQIVDLEDPSVTEISISLPLEDKPYRPCFAYAVEDARTDQAIAEPVCLELFPAPDQAPLGSAGSSTKPGDADAPAGDSAVNTSSGCALRAGSSSHGESSAVGLLLAAGLFLAQRRGHCRRRQHASR